MSSSRQLAAIMFTDMVDSTAMTEELGDEVAMELVNAHDGIVRAALGEFDGREVKHLGDGIMASFVSAVCAVRAACRIQGDIVRFRDERPHLPLALKIGAAAGEPVEQGNDLFGSTVQLASRLCGEAVAGQIIVSTGLAELCRGKGLQFDDLGALALKGFADPVPARADRALRSVKETAYSGGWRANRWCSPRPPGRWHGSDENRPVHQAQLGPVL